MSGTTRAGAVSRLEIRKRLLASAALCFFAPAISPAAGQGTTPPGTTPPGPTPPVAVADTTGPAAAGGARRDFLGHVGRWEAWLATTRTTSGLHEDPEIIIGPDTVLHGRIVIDGVDRTQDQINRLAARLSVPEGPARQPPLDIALPEPSDTTSGEGQAVPAGTGTVLPTTRAPEDLAAMPGPEVENTSGSQIEHMILHNTANITVGSTGTRLFVVGDPQLPSVRNHWEPIQKLIDARRATVTLIPVTVMYGSDNDLFETPDSVVALARKLSGASPDRAGPGPTDANISAAVSANQRILSAAKMSLADLPIVLTVASDGTIIKTPLASDDSVLDALAQPAIPGPR